VLVALGLCTCCDRDPSIGVALMMPVLWFQWQGSMEQYLVWRVARSLYNLSLRWLFLRSVRRWMMRGPHALSINVDYTDVVVEVFY
jgi:hypothetical protein